MHQCDSSTLLIRVGQLLQPEDVVTQEPNPPDNDSSSESASLHEEAASPGQQRWATTRRGALKAGLFAGAAIGVGGWRSAPASGSPIAPAALRKPGSLPYPKLAQGTDTIPKIKHIVVLMMENHSYDNKLGMLGRAGAEGFTLGTNGLPTATNPYANGDIQHAFRMPTTCQLSGMPSQTWLNSHIQLDDNTNQGFVESGSGPVSMGYWQQEDQPFYYSMANIFPIADHYHCSVLGQTWPNRRYLLAATSLGTVNDTFTNDYPKNGTIFDHLHKNGIAFRDYYSTLPMAFLYPKITKRYGKSMSKIDRFFDDAKEGKLPGVCYVEPNYETTSEENPQNIAQGEQFAAKVIEAVMSGPEWESTLLIWTYDEHGGYYDHVPPPAALAPDNIPPAVPSGESTYTGFKQYGFRVPCAIISPFSRADYVSHKVMDHTSTLALIQAKWNLPAMTYRDANAHNMLDMLDLTTRTFHEPPTLAKPLVDTDKSALKCNVSGPGTIPPPGSVTPPPG
jgi:phospholipase C